MIRAADLFAGGGGMTHGAKKAGVDVIVAVNHDQNAIDNHALNHPHVHHFRESVWAVDPLQALGGQPIDLLLASPDCRHFSRAKGGPTKDKGIRGLAWVVLRWAARAKPRTIIVENVEEFRTWGPLKSRGGTGRVWKERAGETFARWVGQLEALGYTVEHRVLCAADYGTPTTRRRLFVVARLHGRPAWPEPTHGAGRSLPWRTAAEVIDWSDLGRSIFGRPRPLAEATMRRIAEGVRRFVLGGRPFLIRTDMQSDGRLRGVAPLNEPIRTVTSSGGHAVVSPFLVNTRNGERLGQAPRVRDLGRPLGVTTAQGSQGGLVAAFLAKHNGSGENWNAAIGQSLDEPLHTVTGRDTKALVAAFLCKYYGSGGQWQGLDEPLHTIVAKARFGLVVVPIDGEDYVLTDICMRMLQPHELAAANGAADMRFVGTKEQQIARIGNMVCPPVIEALVRANFPPPVQHELFEREAA